MRPKVAEPKMRNIFQVLKVLDNYGTSYCGEICRRTDITMSGVFMICHWLVEKNLINYRDNKPSRRRRMLVLTPRGKFFYNGLLALYNGIEEREETVHFHLQEVELKDGE